MTQQLVPGKEVLRRYAQAGLTQRQMVEAWERESNIRVSRSAMGMALARYEIVGNRRRRARYEDMIPWTVKNEHQKSYDLWMLRLEARRRRGEEIDAGQLSRLNSWRLDLIEESAVIVYDPDTEQGFFWVPRVEGDDDIIRVTVEPPNES